VLGNVLIARDDLARGVGHLGLSLTERDSAVVRALLARTLWGQGKWSAALAQAEFAWKKDPALPEVIATFAWMLATTPEESRRDPNRSIELIRPQLRAAESLTDDSDPRALEAAAAAFAAAGAQAQADALFVAALRRSHDLGLLRVASSIEMELEIVRKSGAVIETATSAKHRISSGSWSPEGFGVRAIPTPRD
jgi:hypothetical protein